MISAHWMTRGVAVTAMKQPQTIHDFGGFPQALYDTQYPAPGAPDVARRLVDILAPETVIEDHSAWGFDHGSWGVVIKMYPQADIPMVQLSVDATKPAVWHYDMGRKLAQLRDEGILLVGSGVGEGEYNNEAWAADAAGSVLSNIASATVRIVPDPTFDCSDIIGKVFDDKNANGYQDEGEPGIPNVRIATVTNFPHGNDDIDIAVAETRAAVAYGTDEVDVVFPYKALMAGDQAVGFELVKACKAACGESVLLKVIIESGELKTPELIRLASEIAIDAGADFIKTSTGKVPVNATLEAAKIMLDVIKEKNPAVGFKAAGGVKNAAQAAEYLALATSILGDKWISPRTFRFGASSLLADLLATLGHQSQAASSGY